MAAPRKRVIDNEGPQRGAPAYVSETGRLSLPIDLRRAVGLERGGAVRIELVDGTLRIRTMKDIRDHIRAVAQKSGLTERASVSDFLDWRATERAEETGNGHGA